MTDSKTEKKPKSKYWYRFHITECVLCGSTDEWKERVYDKPKPDNGEDRMSTGRRLAGITFANRWCSLVAGQSPCK